MKLYEQNKFDEIIFNSILKEINKIDIDIKKIMSFVDDKFIGHLHFIDKYYFANIIIRFLIVNHLKKYECFYHKTNKKYNFELLNSCIYKKLFHLDFGSKIGNCHTNDRSILLERFYKNRYLKINFFDNNVNYNEVKNFIIKDRKIKSFSLNI